LRNQFGGEQMRLYLSQHGKAKNKEEDATRPLSDSGRAETEKVARFIYENTTLHLTNIFHSGKLRAKQTAEIFNKHFQPSGDLQETDGLTPMDDPNIWAKEAQELKNDVMLVGHLPHMSKLAAVLLCQDVEKLPVKFKNSGVVLLVKDDSGDWSLEWMIIPDLIR
jgi:phosphohistidine phosphatase